jgi:hypothetical protein
MLSAGKNGEFWQRSKLLDHDGLILNELAGLSSLKDERLGHGRNELKLKGFYSL